MDIGNTKMVLSPQGVVCQLGVRPQMPFRYAGGMSKLREMRENRGFSQQQLAEKVVPPTSQPQIDRLEKSQRKLTKQWAERLARALDCHWLELMGDELPVLSEQEKAILDLYRGLSDADKSAIFRHIDALAKAETGSNGNKGSNGG
jgi:transcriptional regulator with XRE-family HTH domain